MMIRLEFSRIVCVSLFSYQGCLLFSFETACLYYHISKCLSRTFFQILLKSNLKRRRRDLTPRAAMNDLLPFQGSPFGQRGYFSKLPYLLSSSLYNCLLSCDSLFSITDVFHFVKYFFHLFFQVLNKRREWDSNPRALADKRFSRPPRYDHFDISPYIIIK